LLERLLRIAGLPVETQADCYRRLGRLLRDQLADQSKAEGKWRALGELVPGDLESATELVRAARRRRVPNELVAELNRLLAAPQKAHAGTDTQADVLVELGIELAATKDYGGAATRLSEALAIRPDDPIALEALVRVAAIRGDDGAAIAALEQLL